MTDNNDFCRTKYPIILIHGLGLPDNSIFFNYWSKIPDVLKKYGANVFLSGHPHSGTHAENAAIIKKRIQEILHLTNSAKINIIAHSKGGVEARYMLSKMDMAEKVASLTTLSTPHRGSTISKLILENRHELNPLIFFNTLMTYSLGIFDFNVFKIGEELTPDYMKKFNEKINDVSGVYYQSYGGVIDNSHPNLLWRHLNHIMLQYEGENDGLVSSESFQWGNFKGCLTVNERKLVSHYDLVGLHQFTGVSEFNSENFFSDIAHDLKTRGF